MPTKHRQQMIDQGLSPPHHGHDKRAVRKMADLKSEEQALRDAAATAANVAAEHAQRVQAEKRVAHAARHQREAEMAAASTTPRPRAQRVPLGDKALREAAAEAAQAAAAAK